MVIPNVFGKRCSYYLVDLSLADAGRVAPIRGAFCAWGSADNEVLMCRR